LLPDSSFQVALAPRMEVRKETSEAAVENPTTDVHEREK